MAARPARELSLWAPPVLWAALIFTASSISDTSFAPSAPDWMLHATVYGVLGVLVTRALAGSARRRPGLAALMGAVVLSTAYGALDEVHQMFVPGRTPEVRDALADAVGATLGAILGLVIGRLLAARVKSIPVVLYTKRECSLCGPALRILRQAAREHVMELRVVDVAEEPGAEEAFGAEVPVVLIGGRKAFKYRIDPAALDRRLRDEREQASGAVSPPAVSNRGAA